MKLFKTLSLLSILAAFAFPVSAFAVQPTTAMCTKNVNGPAYNFQEVNPDNVAAVLAAGGFYYTGPTSGNKNDWCIANAPAQEESAPSVPEFGLIPGAMAALVSAGTLLKLRRKV